MAFCSKGFSKLKEFSHKVDDVLEKAIVDVTNITGKIKAIEGNPTVEQIVDFIPNGSTYENWLNTAMDMIVPALQGADTLAHKISDWLDGKSDLEKNAGLVKLASVAVGHSDNNKETESFYDTATQVHIEGLK